MTTNLYIPQKLNIGFRNRHDTYTGKLAYIIYYDEKNKLRKETSWQKWRDASIDNIEVPNTPTTGFVLNKKAGDYSGHWGNHRQAYCRIYDPRDFEFEITINNLLFILENASSTKGKGLEGEFVYSWSGKDLVLLPVDSADYKSFSMASQLINTNQAIKPSELILGGTYLTKQNEELVYMGRFDKYNLKYNNLERTFVNQGKYFWFIHATGKYFEQYKSVNKKLIQCMDDTCTQHYADYFEVLQGDIYYSPLDESKTEYIEYTLEELETILKYNKWFKFYSNQQTYEVRRYRDVLTVYGISSGWYIAVSRDVSLKYIYDKYRPAYKKEFLTNGRFYSVNKVEVKNNDE